MQISWRDCGCILLFQIALASCGLDARDPHWWAVVLAATLWAIVNYNDGLKRGWHRRGEMK